MKKGYMYILLCFDETYYVGSTINLEERFKKHQSSNGAKYTKNRLPVKLVCQQEFTTIAEAFKREKQVQGWSRRKREALIKGDYNRLPKLSRNYTEYGKFEEE